MKRVVFLLPVFAAVSALAAGSVDIVKVTQNWPWDNRVIIEYILSGDEGTSYDLDLSVESPRGPVKYKANALDDELYNKTPGTYRLTWNPDGRYDSDIDAAAVGLKFTLTCREAGAPGKYMVIDIADSENYSVEYLADVPAGGWTDAHKKSKMVFRRIRPGYFMMGSPEGETGHLDSRKSSCLGLDRQGEALHPVLLTNEYWIAICPATYAQICYIDRRAKHDGARNARAGGTIDYWINNYQLMDPARSLNWVRLVGADNITSWPTSTDVGSESIIGQMRSRLEGKGTPQGLVFAMPTQAQWEYACRAGTETAWNNGTDCMTNSVGVDANLDLLGIYQPLGGAVAISGNVCTREPNAWGLYDCHGLVGEVVYGRGAQNNVSTLEVEPTGEGCTREMFCAVRGGWWQYCWAVHCRSAAKIHSNQAENVGKTAENSTPKYHSVRFAFIRPRSGNQWR
jgi:formylglycine-generating enzyme required for sulfatase activity